MRMLLKEFHVNRVCHRRITERNLELYCNDIFAKCDETYTDTKHFAVSLVGKTDYHRYENS